ncbi:MAG: hypothetical protein RSA27_06770 [Oscillospiraceae bacterium]
MNNSYAIYAFVGGEVRVIDSSTNKTGKPVYSIQTGGERTAYITP